MGSYLGHGWDDGNCVCSLEGFGHMTGDECNNKRNARTNGSNTNLKERPVKQQIWTYRFFLKQGGMPEFGGFWRDIWGIFGGNLEDVWRIFRGKLQDIWRTLRGD